MTSLCTAPVPPSHRTGKPNTLTMRHAISLMRGMVGTLLMGTFLLLTGCEPSPESTFQLAPDSRLPKWFSMPPNLTRPQVTAELNYYVTSVGTTVTVTFFGPQHKVLEEVKGVRAGDAPRQVSEVKPGSSRDYPMYAVITANGLTDVVEHRKMEPIFWLTDDPKIWAELVPKK